MSRIRIAGRGPRLIAAAVLAAFAAGVLPAAAPASDASLSQALGHYKKALTVDIAYLASFTAPSDKPSASAALKKLSRGQSDLRKVSAVLSSGSASTAAGRKAKTQIAQALKLSLQAIRQAKASARAAQAGESALAGSRAAAEGKVIGKAIALFTKGGKTLHLL